ncbi:MAG TPA: hypothetical protein VM433_03445 [Mycobacteriales bacterium]|nr:hypothetical protein [Mycobacteriales bacterium]
MDLSSAQPVMDASFGRALAGGRPHSCWSTSAASDVRQRPAASRLQGTAVPAAARLRTAAAPAVLGAPPPRGAPV